MDSSQIPAHVRGVIELFAEELSEVRFGDVDHAALEAQVAGFERAAAAEAEAYAQLQEARRALDRELFELEAQAERALAYARVYARDREALLARLEEVEALRPASKSSTKRRKKSRKKPKPAVAAAPAAELPFGDGSGAEAAEPTPREAAVG